MRKFRMLPKIFETYRFSSANRRDLDSQELSVILLRGVRLSFGETDIRRSLLKLLFGGSMGELSLSIGRNYFILPIMASAICDVVAAVGSSGKGFRS